MKILQHKIKKNSLFICGDREYTVSKIIKCPGIDKWTCYNRYCPRKQVRATGRIPPVLDRDRISDFCLHIGTLI